jgi:hypothetical protein
LVLPGTRYKSERGAGGRVSSASDAADAAGFRRRFLPPLATCLAAALIGGGALFVATRREPGESPVLLLIGWTGVVVAAIASLVFAARSGRLEGEDPAANPERANPHPDLSVRAGSSDD